jgi:hypothetical protein
MLICIVVIIICSTYCCVIADFNMLVTNKQRPFLPPTEW